MDEGELRKYLKAGKIVAKVLRDAEGIVREGVRFLEVCDALERRIFEAGGKPAFPCNLCVNEVAAHYTSSASDAWVIAPNSVVKVDIGVHVDGFIADAAKTIVLNERLKGLAYAAEDALKEASKVIGPGLSVSKVGSVVERAVKSHGFKPIWNLSGHQIARYSLHGGTSVPNVRAPEGGRFEVDGVYAVEPFLTLPEAAGEVVALPEAHIYKCIRYRKGGDDDAEALLSRIWENYRTLPFAERWLPKLMGEPSLWHAWERVKALGLVKGYPVLREKTQKPVAQAEHTVLVTSGGCLVLTEP